MRHSKIKKYRRRRTLKRVRHVGGFSNYTSGGDDTLTINHIAGFFSTCSVILHEIIRYFNKYKKLPLNVNTANLYNWYKNEDMHKNIKHIYFKDNIDTSIEYIKPINYNHEYQFTNYKNIEYKTIEPFIKKYFTPSDEILDICTNLKKKYNTHNKEICTLFYRGNDKARETKIPSYDDIITKGLEVQKRNPSVTFFIQSDEKQFIDKMTKTFTNSFYFKDDIRVINKSNTTVDSVYNKKTTSEFSKKYLAITLFMSESKHIICNSGNCSIWIMFFRGNSNNVDQYLNGEWF